MAKYKILVIPSDTTGCGKFRSVDPHKALQEEFGDLFEVDIKYINEVIEHKGNYVEFLRQYDLVHIHKQFDPMGYFVQMCKFLGLKVAIDLDDHYQLPTHHPLYRMSIKDKWAEGIMNNVKYADCVTTTTDIFKKILIKRNRNVEVLPNAINPDESQFQPNKPKSERLRVGIICGSSHVSDVALLSNMFTQFTKEELDKLQFVICGFDTRGESIIVNPDGTKTREPIKPTNTSWYEYEKVFTNDYKLVSPEYKNFLMLFAPNAEYPLADKEPYRRCWTKPIDEYATHYNNIDVLLVPLKPSEFNSVKSQLKVIEAGFHHTAIIASDFGPYTIDLKSALQQNSIDKTGNSILVEPGKDRKIWSKAVKLLLKDRNLLHTLQENLYETVKEKYSLKTVTEKRKNIYLKLLEN